MKCNGQWAAAIAKGVGQMTFEQYWLLSLNVPTNLQDAQV